MLISHAVSIFSCLFSGSGGKKGESCGIHKTVRLPAGDHHTTNNHQYKHKPIILCFQTLALIYVSDLHLWFIYWYYFLFICKSSFYGFVLRTMTWEFIYKIYLRSLQQRMCNLCIFPCVSWFLGACVAQHFWFLTTLDMSHFWQCFLIVAGLRADSWGSREADGMIVIAACCALMTDAEING